MIKTSTFEHNSIVIDYKFRRSTHDRKQLIVFFSGFREKGTYDYDGAASKDLRSNILWIKDLFNDNFSYYLQSKNIDLTESVNQLIVETMNSLGITKNNVTLAGFSKGGTAALYYACTFDYLNVLATVPQFNIGSYLSQNWPAVLKDMAEDTPEAIDGLNKPLVRTISSDVNISRNIYLFTSPADEQYKTEILPHLYLFKKYANFNLIETSSPLVRQHNHVTRYNVPTINSILSMLSEGIIPQIGSAKNGLDNFGNSAVTPGLAQVRSRKEPIGALRSVKMEKGLLYCNGEALMKGFQAKEHGDAQSSMILKSKKSTFKFKFGSVIDETLSIQYFDSEYCDYRSAKFSTVGHKGINLGALPFDRYQLSLSTVHGQQQFDVKKPYAGARVSSISDDGVLYMVESGHGVSTLIKRPLEISKNTNFFYKLVNSWLQGSRLHLEGNFAVFGQPTPEWSDIQYFVLLQRSDDTGIVKSLPIAKDHKPSQDVETIDPWNDYSKSYFSTPSYKGVDLGDVRIGEYRILLSAITKDLVTTVETGLQLDVSGEFESGTTTRSVGIIGSCVSRDNFNSRLAPGWKDEYSFQGAHYQMSLISLMSPPTELSVEPFSDLDSHSFEATQRDFTKVYLDELQANPPEVLIVDLFTDARFGCIATGSSIVTDNLWKIGTSKEYSRLNDSQRYSMDIDEDIYLSMFNNSCEEFIEFKNSFLPNTRLFLNAARAAQGYYDNGVYRSFDYSSVENLNRKWDMLDSVFKEVCGPELIDVVDSRLVGDPRHPWGLASVHYQPEFYERFSADLRSQLGFKAHLNLRVPSE